MTGHRDGVADPRAATEGRPEQSISSPFFGVTAAGLAIREVVAWSTEAERLGFDLLAFVDSPALWHEMFCQVTLAAAATTRIRLATAVTNIVTRNIGVVAAAAATVDELAPGRFQLGLGVGDSGVLNLGERPASIADLERGVAALRRLTAGRDARHGGVLVRNRWAHRGVPILLAGSGPRMLALAGRVADGVIVGGGFSPVTVADGQRCIDRGQSARESDLSSGGIEVWYQTRYAVADTRDEAIRAVRPVVAAAGHHVFGNNPLAQVPDDLQPAISQFIARYDSAHHGAPGDSPNVVLMDELGLTDHFVDRFAVAGTPDECARRIRDLVAGGVTRFIMATANDVTRNMQRWGAEVMPLLSDLTAMS